MVPSKKKIQESDEAEQNYLITGKETLLGINILIKVIET
jgi:hypothetical protein